MVRDHRSWYIPWIALLSGDQHLLEVPGPKSVQLSSTRVGAFSVLALTWRTSLPTTVRALRDLLGFRRVCETGIFCQAYGRGQEWALKTSSLRIASPPPPLPRGNTNWGFEILHYGSV